MRNFLRNYSLSTVLFLLFIGAWIGQFVFQVTEVANEAMQHGQAFQWSEFWPQFGSATLENWQSEFLQLFTMVVLTSFLIHKGSAESKDSDEEMLAALKRIENRLSDSSKTKATARRK